MVQIKVYGLTDTLRPIQEDLSDVIHQCLQEAIGLPSNKRFHRFISLAEEDFYYSSERTHRYIILEIIMFEGRSVETKKKLLRLLMARIHSEFKLPVNDIEITLFETPKVNWGIRGMPGDELNLNYNVEA